MYLLSGNGAQSGISAMRDIVTGWASSVYDYIACHVFILFYILVGIVIIILIHTLAIYVQVKKSKKYKIDSTNDWFDWKEFEAYEKKSKSK